MVSLSAMCQGAQHGSAKQNKIRWQYCLEIPFARKFLEAEQRKHPSKMGFNGAIGILLRNPT
jgi:hypothetical protein